MSDFWVLDWSIVVGDPKPPLMPERMAALSLVCASDGVHFTLLGRTNMATAISKVVTLSRNGALVTSRGTTNRKYFWRGFVSCEGSKSYTETKRFHQGKGGRGGFSRPHPYQR